MIDIDIIDGYIQRQIREQGLYLSLHPFSYRQAISGSKLLEYNIHSHPYCLYLKANPRVWRRCLRQQRQVWQRVRQGEEGFCGACFAGVWEYVYPLFSGGEISGFLSVSGYRCPQTRQRAGQTALRFEMPVEDTLVLYGRLSEELPTKGQLDQVVFPLQAMLETAYRRNPLPPLETGGLYAQVLNYLRMNHTDPISVEKLGKRFFCSRSTISHLFKQHNGLSIREYVNILRVNDAKRMLRDTACSVEEIAAAVGFANSSYFSTVFRQATGMTPLRYRHGQTGTEPSPKERGADFDERQFSTQDL